MSGNVLLDREPKFSEPVFLGFMWAGTSFSFTLLVFRLIVKFRAFRRVGLDDALVVFAWLLLLATSIIWQLTAWKVYEEFDISTGKKPFYPGFLDIFSSYLRTLPVLNVLTWTTLWAVKVSFLLFFKQLGSRTRSFRNWWWFCLILTLLCYIPCIAAFNWACTVYPIMDIIANCAKPEAIKHTSDPFIAMCVLDIFTDFLIISIPIIMLWPVKLPWRQKLTLMGIFSATVFVMVVSIVRVAGFSRGLQVVADQSWLSFWAIMEMSVSVMIACLGSFRQLFVSVKASKVDNTKTIARSRQTPFSLLTSRRRVIEEQDRHRHTQLSDANSAGGDKDDNVSTDFIPLQGIHIKQDYTVTKVKLAPSSIASQPSQDVHSESRQEMWDYTRV